MKNNKILLSLLVLCALFLFAGCESKTDLSAIKENGVIKMGTEAGYPPYEYTVIENGETKIEGFDIDIGQMIADELGVELQIVDMDFDGLLPALSVGDVDMVIAGMNPTDERRNSADFSKSYYSDEQMLLIAKDKLETYKEPSDLEGVKLGVQLGTIQESIAIEEFPNSEVLAMPKISDLVLELKAGNVEGILLVKPTAKAYAENNGDLALADFTLGDEADEGVSIAVAKGQDELLKVIDDVLGQIEADGTLDALIQEYFSE